MLTVYRGVKHQYGYGLGSLLKSALKCCKKEGIKQAEDIFLSGKKKKKKDSHIISISQR